MTNTDCKLLKGFQNGLTEVGKATGNVDSTTAICFLTEDAA